MPTHRHPAPPRAPRHPQHHVYTSRVPWTRMLMLGAAALTLGACQRASDATPVDSAGTASTASTIVIEHARIFDGSRDLGEQTLVVRDGRIVHVGDAAPTSLTAEARGIDYSGRHLIPGLVSNHSHVANTDGLEHGDRFYTRDNVIRDLRQFQAYGITTVTALGMNGRDFIAIRDEVREDPTLGAQLYGAAGGIGAPGGAPPAQIMGLEHDPVLRPADAGQAREAVRMQADAGVDLIKLWVDDLGGRFPMMTPEVYRAAITEAHARGLKVAAHLHDLAQAEDLVASGLDIIGHGVRDMPVSDTLVAAMARAGTWYVPTVNIDEANYVYAEHPQWLDDPFLRKALPPAVLALWSDPAWRTRQLQGANIAASRKAVAVNLANLRTLHAGGIRIGFGTDSGAMPQRVVGFAEHRELELMTQAGFTPAQALSAATRDAATLLGLDDRGTIAVGKRADFVVLDADPTADIRNSRRIHAVWQAGREVAGAMAASTATAAAPSVPDAPALPPATADAAQR